MRSLSIILFVAALYSCVEEPAPQKETVNTITTKVETIRDTVYRDTVIVETIHDTLFITLYFIHPYYIDLVDRFYSEADAYGWTLPKNNLIVIQWAISDMVENGYPEWYKGDGIAIAYQDQTQWYVQMNEILRSERQFIPLFRELGHVLLGKPYTDDPNDWMCYGFQRFFTEREYDETIARPYLDKLFEN